MMRKVLRATPRAFHSNAVHRMFLVVVATSSSMPAFAETWYCPWADTVVRIELNHDKTLGWIEDGTGSLRYPDPLFVNQKTIEYGATAVESLEATESQNGWRNVFLLEYWKPDSVRLVNKRFRLEDGNVWTQRGWCIR